MTAIFKELRAAGLLTGEVPEIPDDAATSRWILALQVAGGWLAALFLLAFVGLGASAFVKSGGGWLLLGVLATALAGFGLHRNRGVVLRQFLFALSLAGQGAFAIGALKLTSDDQIGWLLVGLFEAAVCVGVSWTPHRLIAALVVLGALQGVAAPSGLFRSGNGWFATWVLSVYWLAACAMLGLEARWRVHRSAPVLSAFAAALAIYCLLSVAVQFVFELGGNNPLRGQGLHGIGLSLVSFGCLAKLGHELWRGKGGVSLLVAFAGVCLATWQSPGFAMGLTAMVFGFRLTHRWLLWLGGVVALMAIGRFYYFLPVDLLTKSAYMILGGILLLGARRLIATQRAG